MELLTLSHLTLRTLLTAKLTVRVPPAWGSQGVKCRTTDPLVKASEESQGAGRHHLITAVVRSECSLQSIAEVCHNLVLRHTDLWKAPGHRLPHGSATNELPQSRLEPHFSFPFIFAPFQPQLLIYGSQIILEFGGFFLVFFFLLQSLSAAFWLFSV